MKRKLLALLLSAAMLLAICLPALCAAAESDVVSSLEENAESGTVSSLEENFDVNAAKNELLSKTSEADVNAYLETLSEAEREALLEALSEEEIRDFAARLQIELDEIVLTPAKNYTAVGELKPPVYVGRSRMFRSVSALADTQENGLILDKKATYDDSKKEVTIRLEAYTTGTVTTSEATVPTDIVLVLDESGSMEEKIHQYTKVYALNKDKTYYVKSGDSYIQVKWCRGYL